MFGKLMESLKPRLRLAGLCAIFMMGTTFFSLVLIYVPTMLSNKILLTELHLGSAILGSIMGQVTLLIAISMVGVLIEKREKPLDEIDPIEI